MTTTLPNNDRGSDRFDPTNASATIHGMGSAPLPATVLDESFGGIGVVAPIQVDLGTDLDIELSIELGGVRSIACVRHARQLPTGSRLGLEWKAQALSRGLRELLSTQASRQYQDLVRILPGGLSMMWKLFEKQRWTHLLDSADRLRKEAAACHVHSLRDPIKLFQDRIAAALKADPDDIHGIVEHELDQLITTCVNTIRR